MKSRSLYKTLKKRSEGKTGRIIILTGARQTGKTTLAKIGFPEYQYISIEDPTTRGDYLKLTSTQWKSMYPRAVLDEIQKLPELVESIKAVYDQYEEPGYLLLGSSQFLLLQKVRESLAGRCAIFEVFPLTMPELATSQWNDTVKLSVFQSYLTYGKIPDLPPSIRLIPDYAKISQVFDHYLYFGGYPLLADETLSGQEKDEWLKNYIRTYLERDIRDLADFRDLEPFVKIQKVSALLTGNLVNFSDLAREAGISANTAKKFLHYLEISYQAILLKPWYKNELKRLSKSPKLHYLDPGIQRAILKRQGAMSGNEYESAVIAELYKQIQYTPFQGDLYHFRTLDGRETDLIIEIEKGYIAIEIKMTQKVNSTDVRHLQGLDEILDKPLIQSFILSIDPEIKEIIPGVLAIPAALFLS